MNEHTVLSACLLQWVRMEPVSCPESWRSTAPISNRKMHLYHSQTASAQGSWNIWNMELVHISAGVCWLLVFPSPCPRLRGCCGTPACAYQNPKKSPPHYCTCFISGGTGSVFQTQLSHPQCRLNLPAARRLQHPEATRVSGQQPLALCYCWTSGQGWGQAVPARAAQRWQKGAAGFVQEPGSLCGAWHRLPGRIPPCKVTKQDYPRASALIKTS